MVSGLSAQLAQSVSLNSALLVDRSRRKPGESYLFTGREADQHDLESIHALGVNGLLQLASLSAALEPFEHSLFSDASVGLDRTLQSAEANAELDKAIADFLVLLGPYLMEAPTGKVIEWLVRRFRINEFNIDDVLALFLVYHESPHFAKMLSILHIKENSRWRFLLPFKSAAQCVPRVSLVTEMLRDSDLARFVVSLLPSAIKGGYAHRVLLAFNAATLHDFIVRSKLLDEGTVAYLLPALLEPFQPRPNPTPKDAVLGSYILLAALSRKCHLAQGALKTIVGAMASSAGRVSSKQFVSAVVSVCEPQDGLDSFSDATAKAVLRQTNIKDELRKASMWIGVEKFICPLLPGIGRRMHEESASTFLDALVSSPNIPIAVVHRLSAMLITSATSPQDSAPEPTASRRILSNIQQRHPSVLHEVVDEMSRSDDASKEVIEQMLVSLSLNDMAQGVNSSELNNDGKLDMIVASASADAKLRVMAVKNLIDSLSGQQNPVHSQSISSALLARLQDTNLRVLDALYDKPSVVVPVFSKEWRTYIDTLAHVLCTPNAKPKRSILRVHLTFLVSHFCQASDSSISGEVFHRIFFPFLLFSKPRQHTAVAVWEVIAQGFDGVHTFELLRGCIDACKWETEKDDMNTVEKMSSFNTELASKIAENILVSNNYSVHLDALLPKLQDSNSHVRVLGYLVTRALQFRLSGEHQIDAAHKILEAMRLEKLSGSEEFPQDLEDMADSLVKDIVLKPSSKNTTHRLQTYIVTLMPTIPCPTGVVLDWLNGMPSDSPDNRGHRYIELMQTIYKLANSSTSPHSLTMNLLRTLFVNLKHNALAFLAGIWIHPYQSHGDGQQLSIAALRHAAAFLEAHLAGDDGVDFQSILPLLIIVLQRHDVQTRQAALECISLLSKLAPRQLSSVYGMDTIYGAHSSKLQYVDQDDFKRYINALEEQQVHLVHDQSYINTFHQQHLGMSKSDGKRDLEYKRSVLCFLLSHVDALRLPTAQVALLKSIEHVSNKAKALVLLPTFDTLLQQPGVEENYGSCFEEFASLIVSSIDASVSNDLNDQNRSLWNSFTSTVRYCFIFDHMSSSRTVLSRTLERDLFVSLKPDRKIELCELLLTLGTQDAVAHANCKKVLSNILREGPLMVRLLESLQPNRIAGDPPASKRARISAVPEDVLLPLSLLVEVLGNKSLPGSLDLISHLLETLSRVMQSVSPTQADISYIEQLLMSAVENSATNIRELPNLAPSAIRLDILVELIRVADNPQTFHQALLLMASLARLAPDSVLHNVMPVFTFMGSNVFHRDDTYSFGVVQKTVDSIVPVMVSSLKRVHPSGLDLYIAARDFLRVFTDAANHIPRHRRTNFFTHLVDVLGSDEFLAPVCMLLVEKVVNRIVRQNATDLEGSLALPIAILQHYPHLLQTSVLTELLRESNRLVTHIVEPETVQPTFLGGSRDDEPSPTLAVFKRRAQALVIFVGYALKPSPLSIFPGVTLEGDAVHDLVSLLIVLATKPETIGGGNKVDDIATAARSSMDQALGVMPVVDFISAVHSMLQSNEEKVQTGALNLVGDRMENVSQGIRQKIAPTVNRIVDSIRTLIVLHSEGPLTIAAFRALRAISLTTCPGEESSLTAAVPFMISAIRDRKMALPAMTVLQPLSIKLGPRIIPYFREIITECVSLFREGEEAIVEDILGVLNGLITSIPTFWGPGELTQVVMLYVEYYARPSSRTSMSTLMKTITKRAPSKVLLSTMYEMWPSLKTSYQLGNTHQLVAYFDFLKRSVRNAARSEVLEHLRPLFQVFLEAFDELQVSSLDEVEAQKISAFIELVVKLNEAAFKPLFRRLYDWAYVNEAANNTKKITFCHIYIELLDFFKELMTPYMSFLLQGFIDTFQSFSASNSDDDVLWACTIETLTKSLEFDDGGFWRDNKLRQITSPLVAQVAVCVQLRSSEGKTLLLACLNALTDCMTDDALLKTINLDLLMHTRSEDASLRLFALTCSETLWRAHGSKLIGFVAETTTFIAECAEDENENVVHEARKLKNAVENVAGNINGL